MKPVLCVLVALVPLAMSPRSAAAEESGVPVYAGHDVNWWIERLQDRQQRAAASAALRAMGQKAVPAVLVAYVGEANWRIRKVYLGVFKDADPKTLLPLLPELRKALRSTDEARATEAMQLAILLGADADELLPDVFHQLRHGSRGCRGRALDVLIGMGKRAVDLMPQILAEAMKADDLDRVPYAHLLLSIDPTRPETEAYVTALLSDPDTAVRERVLDRVRRAEHAPQDLRASWLLPLLKDDVPRVRRGALGALMRLPEARSAWLEPVLAMLDDPSRRVRDAALDHVLSDSALAERAQMRIVAFARKADSGAMRQLAARLLRLGSAVVDAIPAVLAADQAGAIDAKTRTRLKLLMAAESGTWAAEQIRTAAPDMLSWLSEKHSRRTWDLMVPPPGERALWIDAAFDRLRKGDLPQPIVRGLLVRLQGLGKEDRTVHQRLLDVGATCTDAQTQRVLVRFLSRSKWRDALLADRWMTADDSQAAFYLSIAPRWRNPRHRSNPTDKTPNLYPQWLDAKSTVLRDLALKAYFSGFQGGASTALPLPSGAQRERLRAHLDRKLRDGDHLEQERMLSTPMARELLGTAWGTAVIDLMDRTDREPLRRRLSSQLSHLDTARRRAVEDTLLGRMHGDDPVRAARAMRVLSWMCMMRHMQHRAEARFLGDLLRKITGALKSDVAQIRGYAEESVNTLGKLAQPLEKELYAHATRPGSASGSNPLMMLVRVFPDREDVRKRVLALWLDRDNPAWQQVPMMLLAVNNEWAERAYIDLIEKPEEDGSEHWWAAVGNIRRPGPRAKLREKLIAWQGETKPGSPLARKIETYVQALR